MLGMFLIGSFALTSIEFLAFSVDIGDGEHVVKYYVGRGGGHGRHWDTVNSSVYGITQGFL